MTSNTGSMPRHKAATAAIVLAASSVLLCSPAFADDDQPELWPGAIRLQAQVSGQQVNLTGTSARSVSVEGGYLVKNKVDVKYKCRGYQGDVNKGFLEIKANGRTIENRNERIRAGTLTNHHDWYNVKLFRVDDLVAACRGRSDVQTVESVAHLKNSCGKSERHYRNGSGSITIQLQCSPSRTRAAVTPIRWRYHCDGPNMFVEGTNSKSVERNTDRADLNCVYRGN
jgi:hypothetical protein